MDLLTNYGSSDEDEHREQPAPPHHGMPFKPAQREEDREFLPKAATKREGIVNSLSLPKIKSFPNPKPRRESVEATERDQETVGESKSKSTSSSSLFSSLPLPKSSEAVENSKSKSASSTSLFSSLPVPKASLSSSSGKRVVQFRPPIILKSSAGTLDDEDDDEDEGEKEGQRKNSKRSVSAISTASLASIMPAPRNSTLGALPSAMGSGRRSMIETDNSNSGGSKVSTAGSDVVTSSSIGSSEDHSSEMYQDYSSWNNESLANYSGSAPESSFSDAGANPYPGSFGNQSGEIYENSSNIASEDYAYYGGIDSTLGGTVTTGTDARINPNGGPFEAVDYSYENTQAVEFPNYEGGYADYGHHYEQALADAGSVPVASGVAENLQQVMGKRGRKDAPAEIIEVKQDELMKNRPRQDQVKLTGIAFGPSYQPVSTKGKPSKLHKRKHQIGSLYFDLKQKETELAERRAKGFLTKAQTQANGGRKCRDEWHSGGSEEDLSPSDKTKTVEGDEVLEPFVGMEFESEDDIKDFITLCQESWVFYPCNATSKS